MFNALIMSSLVGMSSMLSFMGLIVHFFLNIWWCDIEVGIEIFNSSVIPYYVCNVNPELSINV